MQDLENETSRWGNRNVMALKGQQLWTQLENSKRACGWSRGRELSGRTADRVGFWWALAGHWKDPMAEYDLSGSLSDLAVFSYRYLNLTEAWGKSVRGIYSHFRDEEYETPRVWKAGTQMFRLPMC